MNLNQEGDEFKETKYNNKNNIDLKYVFSDEKEEEDDKSEYKYNDQFKNNQNHILLNENNYYQNYSGFGQVIYNKIFIDDINFLTDEDCFNIYNKATQYFNVENDFKQNNGILPFELYEWVIEKKQNNPIEFFNYLNERIENSITIDLLKKVIAKCLLSNEKLIFNNIKFRLNKYYFYKISQLFYYFDKFSLQEIIKSGKITESIYNLFDLEVQMQNCTSYINNFMQNLIYTNLKELKTSRFGNSKKNNYCIEFIMNELISGYYYNTNLDYYLFNLKELQTSSEILDKYITCKIENSKNNFYIWNLLKSNIGLIKFILSSIPSDKFIKYNCEFININKISLPILKPKKVLNINKNLNSNINEAKSLFMICDPISIPQNKILNIYRPIKCDCFMWDLYFYLKFLKKIRKKEIKSNKTNKENSNKLIQKMRKNNDFEYLIYESKRFYRIFKLLSFLNLLKKDACINKN